MKKIGLLGGMSWKSSLEYYRMMNELVYARLGKAHSVNCLLYSFDFEIIKELQHQNKWDTLTQLMVNEAKNLKRAKADCLMICSNTMHVMVLAIQKETGLHVIHIAHATADEINKKDVKKVLLLGTKFTMEGTFYQEILNQQHIEVVIPSKEDRQIIHDVIYNELIAGIIRPSSKENYLRIIHDMKKERIQGVVLGCTEIPLLIHEGDVDLDVFDTTYIHAKAAVEYALHEHE